MNHAAIQAPSPWVTRFSHLVPERARVLDVAGGYGRHSEHFLKRNCTVVTVDIDTAAIESIASRLPTVLAIQADIEHGPWPLIDAQGKPQLFDAVVVTNYLWRPLMPTLLASLGIGGVLIYETFAQGNEGLGKPSRPDFLLRRGELLEVCKDMQIVAFEEGFLDSPPRIVQRIVSVNGALTGTASPHPLL